MASQCTPSLQVSVPVDDGLYEYDGARMALVPECPRWTAKEFCCCRYCALRAMGIVTADAIARRSDGR